MEPGVVVRRIGEIKLDNIIELVEENNRIRGENQDLTSRIQLRTKMNFKEPFYFQDGDLTPFCPACWETKNTPVHVMFGYDGSEDSRWDCPSCKHMYLVKKYRGVRAAPFGFGGGPGSDDWMAR